MQAVGAMAYVILWSPQDAGTTVRVVGWFIESARCAYSLRVKRPTSSGVKRMAAARAGIGMRASGSEQGKRGVSRVILAIRVHAGTVVGERSSR